MKVLGFILAACLALALLQYIVFALALVAAVTLLWMLFTRPREVFGLLLFSLVAGLAQSQPLALMGLVALITVAGIVRSKHNN